jgi:hypothetical protein
LTGVAGASSIGRRAGAPAPVVPIAGIPSSVRAAAKAAVDKVFLVKKTSALTIALLLLVLAFPAFAASEGQVRVFVLRHKRVEEAALLIGPHLSPAASVTLTQRLNAMTVTDREENLVKVEKIVRAFDVPPRGFHFAVRLVRARADVPQGSMAGEIGGLAAKLKSLFQFNDYALLDSTVLQGAEGSPMTARLGEEFVLTMQVAPAGEGNELLLSPLALSRLKKDDRGRTVPVPLYRARIPVTLNQTTVVGASRDEASKTALILILVARENPRADAEAGTAGQRTVEKNP